MAAYGRGFSVNNIDDFVSNGNLTEFPSDTTTPVGDRLDLPFTDTCGNTTSSSGVFNFWGLIEEGYLKADGTANDGIEYFYDECSRTVSLGIVHVVASSANPGPQPFVYDDNSKVMVSFDDARSLEEKGGFIEEMGLAGFTMWNIAGDYEDILVEAITRGMS